MAMISHILSLLAIVAPVVYSQTCYVAPGVAADDSVVPCGGSGVSHCCQLGDICLSDSACFNYASGVTYLYGCTDSGYADAACPWKCGSGYTSAPYVGVTYCPTPGDLWSCTKPPNDAAQVQAMTGQLCNDDSQIAFAASAVLDPILALPTSVGGSTGYYSTINPTSFTELAGYTPVPIPANVVPSKPSTPEQVVPHTTHTTAPTTTTQKKTTKTKSIVPPTSTTAPSPTSTESSIQTTVTSTETTPTSTEATSTSIPPTKSETTSSSGTNTVTSLRTTVSPSPSLTSTSSSSTLISSTSTTSQASSSTATGAASSSTPIAVASSGLSTGAKIGIGVGVAGGVLFVLALILFAFMWRRRRHSHEPVPQHEQPYSVPYEPKPPFQDTPPFIPPVGGVGDRSELQGDEPPRQGGKHLSGQSDWGSSTRVGDSPAPTYTTFESTPRPGQRPIHELGVNF